MTAHLRTLSLPLLVLAGLASFASVAAAETYEVGEGMAYAAIGDVPLESLMPGDTVRIHHRAEPYREKFVIGRRGTESMPITFEGVPGPGGALPVVSGDGATTRAELNYTNASRGVIKIGSSNVPEDTLPAYIVIQNLEVRSARPAYSFDGGESYSNNAAAIYVEKAEHLTIRNCVITDSGNGLFIGAFDGTTQHILVEGNHIYGNGIAGSAYEHNSYTAAIDITFQYNHYGPLRDGCDGNNLKDRSAGLVVRYNWLESGNRQLDLVDAEDSAVLVNHPSYSETYVYGNVLVEHEGDGNSQLVHYGGDSGTESDYRKGTLHLFNNTIVSTRDGNTTLLRLSTNEESADVRNNVLYVTAEGSRLAMVGGSGQLALSHNWTKPGFRDTHGTLEGTIDDDGTGLTGESPGFVDEAGQDYHLADSSACLDEGGALFAEVLPTHDVVRQYVRHQLGEDRPFDEPIDIGAFEYCAPGACTVERPDAGPPPGDSGAGRDSGAAADGGTPPVDGGSDGGGGADDGGCGCGAAGLGADTPRSPLAFTLLLPVALLLRRARRGARSPESRRLR